MTTAIRTEYRPATDTKGARFVAIDAEGHRVSVPVPYDKSVSDGHREAAKALMDKMGWGGNWYGDLSPTGMVWVCATGNTFRIQKTG